MPKLVWKKKVRQCGLAESEYNKKYYAKNKKRLREYRRKKWREDAEYRARGLDRQRKRNKEISLTKKRNGRGNSFPRIHLNGNVPVLVYRVSDVVRHFLVSGRTITRWLLDCVLPVMKDQKGTIWIPYQVLKDAVRIEKSIPYTIPRKARTRRVREALEEHFWK